MARSSPASEAICIMHQAVMHLTRARRRIFSNLLLFLREHVEQTVQSLSENIIIHIGALRFQQRPGDRILCQLIVLLDHANLFHCVMDDWFESRFELVGTLTAEVFRCRIVASGEDATSISKGHLVERVQKYLLGEWCCLFGSPVHPHFPFV